VGLGHKLIRGFPAAARCDLEQSMLRWNRSLYPSWPFPDLIRGSTRHLDGLLEALTSAPSCMSDVCCKDPSGRAEKMTKTLESMLQSSRHQRGFDSASISLKTLGWGAWIRTRECRNQNPVPYLLATPHSRYILHLEILLFRCFSLLVTCRTWANLLCHPLVSLYRAQEGTTPVTLSGTSSRRQVNRQRRSRPSRWCIIGVEFEVAIGRAAMGGSFAGPAWRF
jgi:hypothetical protein